MSFLKRGRKKDKKVTGSGKVVAPIAPEQADQFLAPNQEPVGEYYQNVPEAPRHSELSVSTPDIYAQYYDLHSSIPTRQPIPQMVSTPRKPKPYNKKRGISTIFSRKKSNSLPQLVTSQGLPPVPPTPPTSAPNAHKIRYTPQPEQRELAGSSLYENVEHVKRVPVKQPPPPQMSLDDDSTRYLYTSVIVDPITGNKTSVRGYERPESRDTQASSLSRDPDYAPGGVDRGVMTDNLTYDRHTPHHPDRREYYAERPIRDAADVAHSRDSGRHTSEMRPDYTQLVASPLEKYDLMSRQEHLLHVAQQQQMRRSALERDRHEPPNKRSDPHHAKRESRVTEKTDSYPTTYSSNHSLMNSFLPVSRHEETQYKFVASGEGNGVLYPVGTVLNGQVSLSPKIEDQKRETIPQSDQLVSYLQERQVDLESRLVELTEQNAGLAAQLTLLSQAPVPPPDTPTADVTSEIAGLRQECEILREMLQQPKRDAPVEKLYSSRQDEKEINELKRIIYRLNVELSRYQSLYGDPLTDKTLPLQQLGEEHTPWLANTSHLSPLLSAYDEQLSEKSALLRENQGRVCELERLVEALEGERGRLEREVQSRPSKEEWERNKQLVGGQKQEVDVLSKELHAAKQELLQLSARSSQEFRHSDEKITSLEREVEKYKSYINSLKSKLESERRTHSSEYRGMKEQARQFESECGKLQSKVREVSAVAGKREALLVEQRATISVLEGKNCAALNSVKALRQKLAVLDREVETSRSNELTAQGYLQELMSMVERTAVERDTYAQLAGKCGNSSFRDRDKPSSVKRKLEKLREITQSRLETALNALGDEDSINGSEKEPHQEVIHLRSLLESRDSEIIKLREAKSSVEQKLDSIRLALPREDPESVL